MLGLEEETTNILGGKKLLGRAIHTAFDLDKIIKEGFSTSVLNYFKKLLDLSDIELSKNLGISTKTLMRTRKKESKPSRLDPVTSDRLYRLARIYAMASEVLGGIDQAKKWLHSPQMGLNNRLPLDLISTEAGSQEVKDLLGRIEHGVFA
jgi:putative toxin-antitoxin system antitoxin component (TIGR02293 family)